MVGRSKPTDAKNHHFNNVTAVQKQEVAISKNKDELKCIRNRRTGID